MTKNEEKLPADQYKQLIDLLEDLTQNSKDIQENGIRADKVVKRMMEQARGDKGEPQYIDINTLVDETIHLAYHGYRGNDPAFNLEIEREFDSKLPEVEVIPQDIGRVILNIFNNACFAVQEKMQNAEAAYRPMFSVATGMDNGLVNIRLRDNGVGIPERVKEKIFLPFYTTKPIGHGNTGLGLSISHDLIVTGHKGELEVYSEPGRFTEFQIRLPIQRDV